MLLAVLAVTAGAVAGPLWRRRAPKRVGSPLVHCFGLLAPGAALELFATYLLTGAISVVFAAIGYVLLSAFGLANRFHPGMLLVTAGLLVNATVVIANGGMPVAGLPVDEGSGDHHGLRPGGHLTPLADVIPVLSDRFSPGDVLLSLGGAVAMFTWIPAGRPRRLA